MRLFANLLAAMALLAAHHVLAQGLPVAYNYVQGEPGPWDQKVMTILGEHFEVRNFKADEHDYVAPKVVSGERVTPLYIMEDETPVQATGEVHVYFVIEADGSVETAIADRQSGCECLEGYLTDAIKAFRFAPAKIDGEAVATTALQTYKFEDPR